MNHFYIYMMYNEKNELLYVGQTKNLKKRFQGHFTKIKFSFLSRF